MIILLIGKPSGGLLKRVFIVVVKEPEFEYNDMFLIAIRVHANSQLVGL